MARGGARKGAGRKLGKTRKVAVLARLAPEIRKQLEREAKRGKRSLSAEIESRLRDTMLPRPDDQTRALTYVIANIVAILKLSATENREFDWRTNRFDFEALKGAVVQLLDWLAPNAELETRSLVVHGLLGAFNVTPEEAARTAAGIVKVSLTEDIQGWRGMRERYEADAGSAYYAYPQAARALKIRQKK